MPSTVSEVGACKDLEGHFFTIGSENKGKDEDMLRTFVEKMALYICTKLGANASQEWTSGKQTVLQEPAHLQVVLARHAEMVKATRDRLNRNLTSLKEKRLEIDGNLAMGPSNCSLKKLMQEVRDEIANIKIRLMDEVDMELTNNERAAHNEAWRKHCKSSVNLKKKRVRVYFLL